MRRALNFSQRSQVEPLAGALFPTTREEFEDLSRGRAYKVSGDSYSGLKRLGENSAIFLWVLGDPDGASIRGVFRLHQRPMLDCDDDGSYYATVSLSLDEALPEISESTFRSVVSDIFTTPTEFYSDLTEVQTQAILDAMTGRERPTATFPTPTSSRRSSVYEGAYYEARFRRQPLPRWEVAERGMYESEPPLWAGGSYGPPPERQRRLPPSDRWRGDHVPFTRTNEPEPIPLPPISLKDSGIQTDPDERLIEAENENRRLRAENEVLHAQAAEKAAEREALEGELDRIRLTLFRQFHLEMFSPEDGSSDCNPAHVESDHREGSMPVQNREARTESPRSNCARQYSPPPLLSQQARYSPVPAHVGSQQPEMSNRPPEDTAVAESVLPPPLVAPPVNPLRTTQSGTAEMSPPSAGMTQSSSTSTSRLPQYVQPPAFSYMPPPQPQWSPGPLAPYYGTLPPPLNPVPIQQPGLPQRPLRPGPSEMTPAPLTQSVAPVSPTPETMALAGGLISNSVITRVGNPNP